MATQPHTSSAGHTAGPWVIDTESAIGGIYINAGKKRICAIPCGYASAPANVAEANARLIAAAPLLAKELQSAVLTYQDRLSLLIGEEREWRGDDEYEDMKGHYERLLTDAISVLALL